MTIAISGVTSVGGSRGYGSVHDIHNHGGGQILARPSVVNPSVQSGQFVGTNAAFAMQFNKPMIQARSILEG